MEWNNLKAHKAVAEEWLGPGFFVPKNGGIVSVDGRENVPNPFPIVPQARQQMHALKSPQVQNTNKPSLRLNFHLTLLQTLTCQNLSICYILYIIYSILYILYSILYTLYYIPYTIYYIVYSIHYILYILYIIYYNIL